YQQRVASYLAMIGAGETHVVWVGLPPMKSSSYNDRIALINRIDYTVVKQSANATYWNPAPFVADSSGNFREYMTLANGKTMRLRQSDGIHLSDEGADLISAVLIDWLSPPKPKEETAAKTTTSPSSAQD
ncbi:MAG: DUF459 domain-containing protein, partial [Acidobacteriaceae bacterium]|nr:DUF459 domain-containing protein [Acidobacteriaceae bacterium]